MKDYLAGKVIFLSGGSGSLGEAMISKLVSCGAKVYFTYKNNSKKAYEISKLNVGKAIPVQMNVENYEDVLKVVNQVLKYENRIDVLINNAGINNDKLFAMMSNSAWQDVVSTNLGGTYNCCKAVIKSMIGWRKGVIINISSVSGIKGISGQCNYAASKAGIIGFTKALANEVGQHQIRVNCIAPGFIQSQMTEKLEKKILENYVKQIALRRLGTATEVANVVSFLASDEASYLTGNVIIVDGGLSS